MTARRPRSKRGEGAKLQDEIVTAAAALLEQTGHEDAVTLRAVARAIGITAPSIYAHFADRDEMVCAVIARTFAELAAALRTAAERESRPVPRLHAVGRAYLDFAAGQPHRYRVLFERHPRGPKAAASAPVEVATMLGADAFGVLLAAVGDCVATGKSSETSPEQGTIRVWVGLHGLATLRASLPIFPWPPDEQLLIGLVRRLADLG